VNPPRARKRFGQHFLVDRGIIAEIVNLISPQDNDHLVEIGPGRGALTRPLMATGVRLSVIEIDRDLAAIVAKEFSRRANFELHLGDALEFDFASLSGDDQIRVVGNLPYNIATALILRLIDQAPHIQDMTFMLQQEVVDRLAANPGSKDYGRLSIMVQSRAMVEPFFDVGPTAFEPPPKITSTMVRITPQNVGLSIGVLGHLEACVRTAFGQRRKTIRNTLGKRVDNDILAACGIGAGQRPEEISVEAFVHLAQTIAADDSEQLEPIDADPCAIQTSNTPTP